MNADTLKAIAQRADPYEFPICAVRRPDLRQLLTERAELLTAMGAIHASLNQPVQFTDNQTSSDVLRLDARLARNMARAAIDKVHPNPNADQVQAFPAGRWTEKGGS